MTKALTVKLLVAVEICMQTNLLSITTTSKPSSAQAVNSHSELWHDLVDVECKSLLKLQVWTQTNAEIATDGARKAPGVVSTN